ncbi:MAG: hypothetical protein RR945_05205 [Erysipelotrichaceae bacterium]|uniref:hypothetical protein n=1 Tax=Anaerorhabdus sp. TaxID=1872524 RepID=UPI002FC910AB
MKKLILLSIIFLLASCNSTRSNENQISQNTPTETPLENETQKNDSTQPLTIDPIDFFLSNITPSPSREEIEIAKNVFLLPLGDGEQAIFNLNTIEYISLRMDQFNEYQLFVTNLKNKSISFGNCTYFSLDKEFSPNGCETEFFNSNTIDNDLVRSNSSLLRKFYSGYSEVELACLNQSACDYYDNYQNTITPKYIYNLVTYIEDNYPFDNEPISNDEYFKILNKKYN